MPPIVFFILIACVLTTAGTTVWLLSSGLNAIAITAILGTMIAALVLRLVSK